MRDQALSGILHDAAGTGSAVRLAAWRLLVIDPDNLHRKMICRAGAHAGYAPAGAPTFEEAVRLALGAAFDCIILDLPPGVDAGLAMLRQLWVMGCKAPIIVIGSDHAGCGEVLKNAASLNLNIWKSLPKPVDLAALRLCFEEIKTGRNAAAAA